jgi:hypothetical protein
MPLQLIIDIGLFLIYCGLLTLLIAWTWKFWMLYVNTTWTKSLKWTTIEIKLPREINKSPEAAEIFLRSLIEGGGLGTWLKEKWEGRVPNHASLEIASLEGVIHFYIRLEKKLKPRVEAAIYSQYPNVEIIELTEDYMDQLPKVTRFKDSAATWASEWVLSKESKGVEIGNKDKKIIEKVKYSGDMYPIKTYKDWGLDKDPKEMYKHDPLTYVLEQLGTMGKGEYFVYQILLRDAAKWNDIYKIEKAEDEKDKDYKGTYKETKEGKEKSKFTLSDLKDKEVDKFKIKWSLKKEGDSIGNDDYGEAKKKTITKKVKELDKDGKMVKEEVPAVYAKSILESKAILPQEREEDSKKSLELIQRKMSKPQVFAIIRTVYIANSYKEFGNRIPMVMGITKPFNEDGFNTFRPSNVTDPNDYPWQDTLKKLVPWIRENTFGDLTGRDGFFSFNKGLSWEKNWFDIIFFNKSNLSKKIFTTLWKIIFYPFKPTVGLSGFTLNIEELATLYHFPGEVAATPSLPRIDSIKGSSPSNLPVER